MAALYQGITYFFLLFEMCTSSTFNMQACLTNQDEWLYPGIQQGVELITGQLVPYATENTDHGH